MTLPEGCPDWQRHLLTDPQTSGGLLIACSPDRAAEIVRVINGAGYPLARTIGRAEAGAPSIRVEA